MVKEAIRTQTAASSQCDVSVVVPFYNEEGNVRQLYAELLEVFTGLNSSFEFIFVNDGSTDGTAVALDELANDDARVKVIHFLRNFGQTAAMMAGIDNASGAILVGMDGDRQNNPKSIPAMIAKLQEGYDVVSGWRRDRKDQRIRRRLPSAVANWLISKISGVELHDYGCSLKVYRQKCIKGVRLYGEMHRFIPIYTKWMGGRIVEMEVDHRPRTSGSSKYGIGRVGRVILDLMLVRFLDKFMTKPIHFFGGFGMSSILLAGFFGLTALYLKVFKGVSFVITPLPLLTALLIMVGLIFVLMGILAEIVIRTYFEAQGKSIYIVETTRNFESR